MRAIIIILLLVIARCFGLAPSQIAILVNADEPASVSVGTYYALTRGVLQSNIIPLRLGRGENISISHKDYIEKVVIPVNNKLSGQKFKSVRCLLTTYMMPYKIDAPLIDNDTLKVAADLDKLLSDYSKIMVDTARQLDESFTAAAYDSTETKINGVKKVLIKNFNRIKAIEDEAGRNQAVDEFVKKVVPLYGVFLTAQMSQLEFDRTYQIPAEDFTQAVEAKTFVAQAVKEKYSYRKCLEVDYYSRYAKVYGVLDLVASLSESVKKLRGVDTSSAFDSELAMVKQPGYEWYKWQPNALVADINDSSTLMVCRIDGPGEKICRNIIDSSVNAEKYGLDGQVCIDSRYSIGEGAEGFIEYDYSLKQTAKLFKNAGWPVMLEETEQLIRSAKPIKTAVYCGWYSLNKYVDAFDFCPGSVGYHIASLEARDIRDANNGQWVSSMLADGISVTLGAVDEPYLDAFPMPDEFFGKLLEGKCVAEAFALTNRYNSWRVMLIGDPLYRPFAISVK